MIISENKGNVILWGNSQFQYSTQFIELGHVCESKSLAWVDFLLTYSPLLRRPRKTGARVSSVTLLCLLVHVWVGQAWCLLRAGLTLPVPSPSCRSTFSSSPPNYLLSSFCQRQKHSPRPNPGFISVYRLTEKEGSCLGARDNSCLPLWWIILTTQLTSLFPRSWLD